MKEIVRFAILFKKETLGYLSRIRNYESEISKEIEFYDSYILVT